VNLQFGYRHRNEFGFGLDGLAHGDGVLPKGCYWPQVAALVGICREDEGTTRDLAAGRVTRGQPVRQWGNRLAQL
jgi:hypothetical protein